MHIPFPTSRVNCNPKTVLFSCIFLQFSLLNFWLPYCFSYIRDTGCPLIVLHQNLYCFAKVFKYRIFHSLFQNVSPLRHICLCSFPLPLGRYSMPLHKSCWWKHHTASLGVMSLFYQWVLEEGK